MTIIIKGYFGDFFSPAKHHVFVENCLFTPYLESNC